MSDIDQWAEDSLRLFTHPELPDDDESPGQPLRATQWASSGVANALTTESPQVSASVSRVGRQGGSQADDQSAMADQTDAEDVEDEDTLTEPAWSGYLEPAPAGEHLHAVLAIVRHHCDAAECHSRAADGTRARTSESLRIHHRQLSATVCLAAKCLLRGAPSFRVPMRTEALKGKRTRYTDPLLTPNLRTAIQLLISEGFIMQTANATRPRSWRFDAGQASKQEGRQATYAAGPRLAPLLGNVQLVDIRRAPGDEIILLKSKRDDLGVAELIDYKRSPAHVSAARAELVELNAFRAVADIGCTGSPARFDVSDRHTRRRWTRASWYCGGRHWGGFWQTMRKAERLNLLRIDGEPVLGIDYVGTIVTLAYAAVGQQLPDGDPYEFTLVDRSGAVVETTRKQRKTFFIAAMNGAKEWPRELRQQFRHRISWRRTVECMAKAHPHVAVFFTADRGQELAHTEANVMAAVLKKLRLEGVVALDMFDCVLVKRSAAEAATAAMLEEFQRVAGQPARVSVERPEDHPMRSATAQPTESATAPWDF